MNKELQEKYEKLGWKFEEDKTGFYYQSPRMKELYSIDSDVSEKKLLEDERLVILALMRTELDTQFDKIVEDIIVQQKLLMEKGLQPQQSVTISFDIEFTNGK